MILKTIVRGLGFLLALPFLLGHALCRPVLGSQRALAGASEWIALIPGNLGVYVRQAFYQCRLERVGQNVHFGFMTLFSKPQATIGDRVYIGRFCTIGYAELGDDVMLADGVQILSGRHQHGEGAVDGQALRDNEHQYNKVSIGSGAWIGAGAVVMADVGERAVVGAGAVVVKPVAAEAKVGGVPAKELK